jgi:hypothetical protein
MNSIKQQLFRYWLAMNASAFDSAVRACTTFTAGSAAHELVPSMMAFDLKQLGLLFVIAFAHGLDAYLKANPISQNIPGLLRLAVAAPPANVPAVAANDKETAN